MRSMGMLDNVRDGEKALLLILRADSAETLVGELHVLGSDGVHRWVESSTLTVDQAADALRALVDRDNKVQFGLGHSRWDDISWRVCPDALRERLQVAIRARKLTLEPLEFSQPPPPRSTR